MQVFNKNGETVNIAMEDELCAKSYANSYKNNGISINFEDVRNYFLEHGSVICNYYLLFATMGATEFWYGVVDWRDGYYGKTAPRLFAFYGDSSVKPISTNVFGTVNFGNAYTYYQVSPVGI